MAKYIDRIKARSMRKQGVSIVVIAKKLGVSKSSVSLWCRDIILTDEQFEKLRKNMGISVKYGQRIAAQVNRQKKLNEIEKRFEEASKIIIKIIFLFLTKVLGVDIKFIRSTLQINFIHKKRVNKVMKFWSKYLNLSLRSFNKPYFVNVVPKKVYENYNNYYGTLRLRVLKSSNLQYKMLRFINVFKEYADVAQLVRAGVS